MALRHLYQGAQGRQTLPVEDGAVFCPAREATIDVERCHLCPWWLETRLDARGDGTVVCRVHPAVASGPERELPPA
jgi:hypothetical protein